MHFEALPQTTFSSTELNEIANKLNDPIIRKYFTHLVHDSLRTMADGTRLINESAESFLERRAAVQGGMVAIEMLLKIRPAAIPPKP